MTVTNCDFSNVFFENAKFKDETFTAAGAGTTLAGTILARKRVSDTVTVAAKAGGNTGTGTCTAASVIAGDVVPKAGAYRLICIAAVTNGGVFQLVDPDGLIVASYLPMTAGSAQATAIKAAGLGFTLTDSGDFIVGDEFVLTVAANGKMVVYASNGAGGAQVPCAILTYPVVATGAGDLAIRAAISGQFRKDKLIIAADGTGANVTNVLLDKLRNYGITTEVVTDISMLDNQ